MPQRLAPVRVPSRVGLLVTAVLALLLGLSAAVPAGHPLGAPSASHRQDAMAVAAAHPLTHPGTAPTDRAAGGSAWRGDVALPARTRAAAIARETTAPPVPQAPVGSRSRDRSPPFPS